MLIDWCDIFYGIWGCLFYIVDINECLSNFCCYNGICIDYVNSFICLCLVGFGGFMCDEGNWEKKM